MEKETVDPLYGYVDEEINAIKKNLEKKIKKLSEALLVTQRILAKDMVFNTERDSQILIRKYDSQHHTDLYAQLVADTVLAFEKINAEDRLFYSLALAISFRKQLNEQLKKLGVQFIDTNLDHLK